MSTGPTRTYFVKTYGCQMNVYDSERMGDALAGAGFGAADSPEDADLIILNTCHIREKAAQKVYSEIGRLAGIRRRRAEKGQKTLIGVAGCVAQAEGEEIIARAPAVDLVVGPQSFHRLPELVARAAGEPVVATDFPAEDKFNFLPAPSAKTIRARGVSAFVTVQEGCDKFCSFCVVPYTRGAESSRPVEKIVAEARRLVTAGVREITLLGQNVNAYHGQNAGGAPATLAELLGQLAQIDGLARLRYTTSHPRDMDDALIGAHRDIEQLMPYLHLPVQSGSDRVLKAMNRRHTRDFYLALIGRIRDARPDIALSGDFIVGFPGETDRDFAQTISLVSQIGYASAYSFKYSPRPGTPGAELAGQIDETLKADRLAELQAVIGKGRADFNRACHGQTLPVLFDRATKIAGKVSGRTPYNQTIIVTGGEDIRGEILPVALTMNGQNSLCGQIVVPQGARR
ncbi:MAG: tRNA (N6-isopentenyl adenosine(37)-C2)-methylthiotransferase MiaB [Alphaproteobacteria bacterium]|nr:tRNA (N6-isopentenyl adenosine(37)-C2)-methylthiotransferase MiaB [Alphaproteobacteria bacterium]